MIEFSGIGEGTGINLTEEYFRYFGTWLYNILFEEWSYCAMDSEKPPVTIPTECLVDKYARRVIYYVSGWTLHSLSKALTIAKDKRGIYQRLSMNHCLEVDEAIELNLPISVVQRRKRWAKIYSTNEYYAFICHIESVYLFNLTLEMMMAHADGDIIHVIKTKMLDCPTTKGKFEAVCNNEDNDVPFSNDEMRLLLKYVLERYANMRGSYFVKYLKGSSGRSSIKKKVESQRTRSKVINMVACTKAVEVSSKQYGQVSDAQLWKEAEDSVIEK